ncbi:MAG: acyltransferase family protein [Acutalibacteraceae bacterium]
MCMSNRKESSFPENRLPYSNDKKKYYDEVNIVRGIALLLVVLGHSFPDGDVGIKMLSANWIRSWFYSFHMGIFFALSGFVMSGRLFSGTYKLSNELKKKTLRLLLPYFVYEFITLGPKLVLTRFVNNPVELSKIGWVFLGKSQNGGMWFLWHLFVISMIYLLAFKLMKNLGRKTKLIITLVLGVVFYLFYLFCSGSFLDNTFKFTVFFAIGIAANQYYDCIVRLLKMPVAIFAIAVTITLACPLFNINRNMIYIY